MIGSLVEYDSNRYIVLSCDNEYTVLLRADKSLDAFVTFGDIQVAPTRHLVLRSDKTKEQEADYWATT